MPPPPLSPAERRLGKLALACAALYGGAGLFFAAFPLLTLQLASQGGPISLGPGARLWHVLSVSMMAMLALCCWQVSKAPRENRAFLLPVLLSKLVSTAMAALTLLRWSAFSPEAFSGRRTLFTVIGTDFSLFLVTAWLYWKAAPGVRFEARPAPKPEAADAPKPIALGLAKVSGATAVAPAPEVEAPPATAAVTKPPA